MEIEVFEAFKFVLNVIGIAMFSLILGALIEEFEHSDLLSPP